MTTPDVERLLPLKPIVLNVLLVLAERDHHGYSLIQTLRSRDDLETPVHTGPLYRLLRRLLDDGLVEELHGPPNGAADDARRGSYYRLSKRGREVVTAEMARLRSVVALGDRLGITTEREV